MSSIAEGMKHPLNWLQHYIISNASETYGRSPRPNNGPPDKLKVDLTMDCPGFIERDAPWNIYSPNLLKYPTHEPSTFPVLDEADRSVQWKDITCTWKGLLLSQAEELVIWEQCIVTVLERYALDVILKSFAREYPEAAKSPLPEQAHLMEEFIRDIGTASFHIDPHRLTSSVIEIFQGRSSLSWLTGSHDPHEAIANVLSTLDCFLPSTASVCTYTASLNARYHYPYEVQIHGLVSWHPPKPFFLNLQPTLAEGTSNFFLTPRYKEYKFCSVFEDPKIEIDHSVSSDSVAFLWDEDLQAFRGTVVNQHSSLRQPTFSQSTPLPLAIHRVDVATVASRQFPSGVRFERSMRSRITLQVAPRDAGVRSLRFSNSLHRTECQETRSPGPSKLHTPRSAPDLRGNRSVPTVKKPGFHSVRSTAKTNPLRDISQNSYRVQGTAAPIYGYDDHAYTFQQEATIARAQPSYVEDLSLLPLPSQFELQADMSHPRLAATYRKATEDRLRTRAKLQEVTAPELIPMMMRRPTTVHMMMEGYGLERAKQPPNASTNIRYDPQEEHLPDYLDYQSPTYAAAAPGHGKVDLFPEQSPSSPLQLRYLDPSSSNLQHDQTDIRTRRLKSPLGGRSTLFTPRYNSSSSSSSAMMEEHYARDPALSGSPVQRSIMVSQRHPRQSLRQQIREWPRRNDHEEPSNLDLNSEGQQVPAAHDQLLRSGDKREQRHYHHVESEAIAYSLSPTFGYSQKQTLDTRQRGCHTMETLNEPHSATSTKFGIRYGARDPSGSFSRASIEYILDSPPRVVPKRVVSPTADVSPSKQLRRNGGSQNLRETADLAKQFFSNGTRMFDGSETLNPNCMVNSEQWSTQAALPTLRNRTVPTPDPMAMRTRVEDSLHKLVDEHVTHDNGNPLGVCEVLPSPRMQNLAFPEEVASRPSKSAHPTSQVRPSLPTGGRRWDSSYGLGLSDEHEDLGVSRLAPEHPILHKTQGRSDRYRSFGCGNSIEDPDACPKESYIRLTGDPHKDMESLLLHIETMHARIQSPLSVRTYEPGEQYSMASSFSGEGTASSTPLQVPRTRLKTTQVPDNTKRPACNIMKEGKTTQLTERSASYMNKGLDLVLKQRGRNPSDIDWFTAKTRREKDSSLSRSKVSIDRSARKATQPKSDCPESSFCGRVHAAFGVDSGENCGNGGSKVSANKTKERDTTAQRNHFLRADPSWISSAEETSHRYIVEKQSPTGPEKPRADSALDTDNNHEETSDDELFECVILPAFFNDEPIQTGKRFAPLEKLPTDDSNHGAQSPTYAFNRLDQFPLPPAMPFMPSLEFATAVPDELDELQSAVARRLAATSAEAQAGSSPHKRFGAFTPPSISPETTPKPVQLSVDEIQARIQRNYHEFEAGSSEALSTRSVSMGSGVALDDESSARMESLFLAMESFSDEKSDQDMSG